jgi:hypothetical protein
MVMNPGPNEAFSTTFFGKTVQNPMTNRTAVMNTEGIKALVAVATHSPSVIKIMTTANAIKKFICILHSKIN